MTKNWINTVKGRVAVSEVGLILPHEHLFTDLRGPQVPDYALAKPEEVALVMLPLLDAACTAGVRALVECSTVGVGRNVAVLRHLAEATPIHLIAPTGVYREGFIPEELMGASVEALASLWVQDLTDGIEGTQVKAGFIKIAMSDDSATNAEVSALQAAALASLETGAVIASHTTSGRIAHHEMDILEAAGLALERFIWVHANLETDQNFHREAVRRGAYVEFDGVGAEWQDQSAMVDYTVALIDAGYAEHILLSHDAGWYQPGRPGGQPEGGMRGYTALVEDFLPRLQAGGVSDADLKLITEANPAKAFGLD